MSETAITITDQRQQLTTQQRASVGRSKAMRVTGKLKVACDLLAYEGMPFNEAAQQAGLSVAAMRSALQRPHVIAYLKAQREVLRASMSGRNILTLAEVRDQTGNQMARVNAVKALEQISDEPMAAPGRAASAGVVIVIQTAAPAIANPTNAQPKPLIEHEDVRHDE